MHVTDEVASVMFCNAIKLVVIWLYLTTIAVTPLLYRWLGVRLDFIGSILILAAGLFTVASRDTLSAGIVGLSLSYALEVDPT